MINKVKSLSSQLQYYFLLLLAFSLPFPIRYANIVICILAALWLLSGDYISKFKSAFNNKLFILATAPFFLLLIGLTYTQNLKQGGFSIEKSLPFLILPLIIFTQKTLNQQSLNTIFKAFILGCFFSMLSSFLIAVYKETQIEYEFEWNFFTIEMPFAVGMTHVYIGLYFAISFFLCAHFLMNFKDKKGIIFYLIIINMLLLVTYIITVTAKMAFIAIFLGSISLILLQIKNYKKIPVPLVIGVVALICLPFMLQNKIPRIKERTKAIFEVNLASIKNDSKIYATTRAGTIKCSIETIKENWLIGVGTGDEKDILNKCYNSLGLDQLYGYDTHNQYFNYLLRFGIIGLLLFILLFLFPLIKSIEYREPLYTVFLLVFILGCLTENLFESNKGIVLFSFFNSLFGLFLSKKVSSLNENNTSPFNFS